MLLNDSEKINSSDLFCMFKQQYKCYYAYPFKSQKLPYIQHIPEYQKDGQILKQITKSIQRERQNTNQPVNEPIPSKKLTTYQSTQYIMYKCYENEEIELDEQVEVNVSDLAVLKYNQVKYNHRNKLKIINVLVQQVDYLLEVVKQLQLTPNADFYCVFQLKALNLDLLKKKQRQKATIQQLSQNISLPICLNIKQMIQQNQIEFYTTYLDSELPLLSFQLYYNQTLISDQLFNITTSQQTIDIVWCVNNITDQLHLQYKGSQIIGKQSINCQLYNNSYIQCNIPLYPFTQQLQVNNSIIEFPNAIIDIYVVDKDYKPKNFTQFPSNINEPQEKITYQIDSIQSIQTDKNEAQTKTNDYMLQFIISSNNIEQDDRILIVFRSYKQEIAQFYECLLQTERNLVENQQFYNKLFKPNNSSEKEFINQEQQLYQQYIVGIKNMFQAADSPNLEIQFKNDAFCYSITKPFQTLYNVLYSLPCYNKIAKYSKATFDNINLYIQIQTNSLCLYDQSLNGTKYSFSTFTIHSQQQILDEISHFLEFSHGFQNDDIIQLMIYDTHILLQGINTKDKANMIQSNWQYCLMVKQAYENCQCLQNILYQLQSCLAQIQSISQIKHHVSTKNPDVVTGLYNVVKNYFNAIIAFYEQNEKEISKTIINLNYNKLSIMQIDKLQDIQSVEQATFILNDINVICMVVQMKLQNETSNGNNVKISVTNEYPNNIQNLQDLVQYVIYSYNYLMQAKKQYLQCEQHRIQMIVNITTLLHYINASQLSFIDSIFIELTDEFVLRQTDICAILGSLQMLGPYISNKSLKQILNIAQNQLDLQKQPLEIINNFIFPVYSNNTENETVCSLFKVTIAQFLDFVDWYIQVNEHPIDANHYQNIKHALFSIKYKQNLQLTDQHVFNMFKLCICIINKNIELKMIQLQDFLDHIAFIQQFTEFDGQDINTIKEVHQEKIIQYLLDKILPLNIDNSGLTKIQKYLLTTITQKTLITFCNLFLTSNHDQVTNIVAQIIVKMPNINQTLLKCVINICKSENIEMIFNKCMKQFNQMILQDTGDSKQLQTYLQSYMKLVQYKNLNNNALSFKKQSDILVDVEQISNILYEQHNVLAHYYLDALVCVYLQQNQNEIVCELINKKACLNTNGVIDIFLYIQALIQHRYYYKNTFINNQNQYYYHLIQNDLYYNINSDYVQKLENSIPQLVKQLRSGKLLLQQYEFLKTKQVLESGLFVFEYFSPKSEHDNVFRHKITSLLKNAPNIPNMSIISLMNSSMDFLTRKQLGDLANAINTFVYKSLKQYLQGYSQYCEIIEEIDELVQQNNVYSSMFMPCFKIQEVLKGFAVTNKY